MTTDALLERVLDKIDSLTMDVSALNVKTEAIVQRLDKLNGSVARHQEALNESQLWRAKHEETCKPRISEATILKSVAMVCVTVLTALGASAAGVVEALLKMF